MRKIKEKKIFIGITLLIVLSIGFLYLNNKKEVSVAPINQNYNQDKIEPQPESQIAAKPLSEKNINARVSDYQTIKISLVVLDKKYETEIKEGSTVFEAMKKIEEESTSDNLFIFKYTEHSGLGSFITEINGIKGTPGKYWIYYVNNEKASVGVSKYIIKEGDIINWKQEGI